MQPAFVSLVFMEEIFKNAPKYERITAGKTGVIFGRQSLIKRLSKINLTTATMVMSVVAIILAVLSLMLKAKGRQ